MSCLILVSEKALLRKNKHNLGIQAASAPDQGLGAVSLAKLHGEDSSKRSVFFPTDTDITGFQTGPGRVFTEVPQRPCVLP